MMPMVKPGRCDEVHIQNYIAPVVLKSLPRGKFHGNKFYLQGRRDCTIDPVYLLAAYRCAANCKVVAKHEPYTEVYSSVVPKKVHECHVAVKTLCFEI